MANEFEDIKDSLDNIEGDILDAPPMLTKGKTELTPEDMEPSQFIKNPEVGQSVLLEVERFEKNEFTTGINKTTGEKFDIGLKSKNGVVRYDFVCKAGTYTISAWEVFYKLFGVDGLLTKYGKKHKTYKGAQIRITRNYSGQYANMPASMIAKLIGKSIAEAEKYKAEAGKAMKDKTLYTVEILNM